MKRSEGQLLLERYWSRVDKAAPNGCWEWTGALFHGGYGRFKAAGRDTVAHRWAYELAGKRVAPGLQLDHLCRNRKCVNPEHLEAVCGRTNVVLRGKTITAENHQKTHCVRGHSLSGPNLLIGRSGTKRICRACKSAYESAARNSDAYREKHAQSERTRRAKCSDRAM